MLSPREFSDKTGLSYDRVLLMCKSDEIECLKSKGGHFNIYDKELDNFINNNDSYVTKEEYVEVVRENERLKAFINQLQGFVLNMNINEGRG